MFDSDVRDLIYGLEAQRADSSETLHRVPSSSPRIEDLFRELRRKSYVGITHGPNNLLVFTPLRNMRQQRRPMLRFYIVAKSCCLAEGKELGGFPMGGLTTAEVDNGRSYLNLHPRHPSATLALNNKRATPLYAPVGVKPENVA
jgi:hypothetical protein